MSGLDWNAQGLIWPHREASAFVETNGKRWHVQRMGEGPPLLLLHGTGASVHSWRGVMPLLARDFAVTAIDLPRHAFTTGHDAYAMSLPAMSAEVARLLEALDLAPAAIVGHSAGAAIGARLAMDERWDATLIGLTPALMPFPGLAARLFPALARMLFVNPFTAMIFAQMASSRGEVARFLKKSTGSRIDDLGIDLYHRLFRTSDHCAGAIGMMANWDLETLSASLPGLTGRTLLIHGGRDAMVPTDSVERAAKLIPGAELSVIPDLGHLAHEEAPDRIAEMILAFAATSPAEAA